MALPVGFEGANFVMLAPASMTPDECSDLPVFRDPQQIISCWRLSPDEIETINATGVIWLAIIGPGMPPVRVAATGIIQTDGRDPIAEPVMPRAQRKPE